MKPTYTRRIRRKPATAVESPAFRKEGQKENTFFGGPAHETFFQPAAPIQRKCEKCEEEEKQVKRAPEKKEEEEKKVQRMEEKKEDEKKLSRKETTAQSNAGMATGAYLGSLQNKGQALPAQAQQFFGARMGYDFSQVKVHTGTDAAQSAKDINAQAYTYKNHIVFNDGKYNTESADGKKLLAHELTHVMQQAPEHVQRKEEPYLKANSITPAQTIKAGEEDVRKVLIGVFANKDSKIYSYISSQLGSLKKDIGLKILSPAEFGHAYKPYAKKRKENIDFSIPDAKVEPDVQGFYDPDKKLIYLRLRADYCHALHETVHAFSNPDFMIGYFGVKMNEGITQYFTNMVVKEQAGEVCSKIYTAELTCATKLIEKLSSFDEIAKVFFSSDTEALKKVAAKFGFKDLETVKKATISCSLVNSK